MHLLDVVTLWTSIPVSSAITPRMAKMTKPAKMLVHASIRHNKYASL